MAHTIKKHIFFTLLFLACRLLFFAQQGNYYINNHAPSMYAAGDQNWGLVQDNLGRLFVANNDAVMMYDGKSWQIIGIKEGSVTSSSVAKTNNNIILAGGYGDFGYLKDKSAEKIKYISLSDSLPEKEKDFGNIWAIHSIDSNRFYCANEKIFWYVGNTFKESFVPTGEKFHTFFNVENTLLIREQGVGFLFFRDGKLNKIKNAEEFIDTKVYAVLPFKANLYWVCSRKGLFILKFNNKNPEQSSFYKINNPATDKWMIDNDVYCGTKIDQNQYALGSLKNGVLIVDANFNPVSNINYNQSGLQEDAVKSIYIDYAGNMWLALNKGVSHVQINTPLKHWNKINGIRGTIESIAKFNGTFYIASDKEVDKLNLTTNLFVPTRITEESWDLLVYNKDIMLAGTKAGLYEIRSSSEQKIYDAPDGIYKIGINPLNKEQLFLAGGNSLFLAEYTNHKIAIIKEYSYAAGIRSMAVNKKGNVFFGSDHDQVFMYSASMPDTLTIFDEKNGLLPNSENFVFSYNDEIIAATDTGLLQFKNNAFVRNPVYNIFNSKTQMQKAIQVGNDIWLALLNISDNTAYSEGDGLCILKHTPSGFVKDYKFFKQIKSLKAHCFLLDSDKVYIGTNDGLISYNLTQKHKDYTFNTFLSKIVQKTDTNIIAENFYEGVKFTEPVFSYKNNEINFSVSASDYYDKNEIEFAHYLEGAEEGYSKYTKADKIPYNNLHEGHYVLHLKSRNILGIEGKPVSFAFTILPPWYRTFWAYALYFIGSIAFITFIVRYNTKRLKEQNIKLEKIITERTKTVEHQKEEIEHKNKEITDSINYAQRIQQAILPPVAEIKKVWKNLFVFYQPKDIVSGDFYWYHKISDTEILIACADCTGHGVPGGFMSMICSDKLNDAVQKTHDPAEILFHVNNNVKKALRQNENADENVNKDGMEIALLRIDFAAKKLWYSGANRLLWVLRKKDEDIEEIKPNKASIASFTELNFLYTGHEIQLDAGDLVYVTSDGYPDQFGGAQGKKFMSKTLKKLILSIRNKEIPEQEKIIKDTINTWMQGYEQVDDLLLIALKM